jgi:antitoxin HigA-1
MAMKKPPHPGRIVRQECIEPLGLTVTDAARHLGVTRQALNNLVNEKSGISPEMSIRLSKAFGSSPEVWLGLQADYDLVMAWRDARRINVRRIASPVARPMPQSTRIDEGKSSTKAIPRTEVTKKLWAYIKKNSLQDKKKKTNINADDKPKAVFGGKKTVSIRDN